MLVEEDDEKEKRAIKMWSDTGLACIESERIPLTRFLVFSTCVYKTVNHVSLEIAAV